MPCAVPAELPNVSPGEYALLAYATKLAAYTAIHLDRDTRVGLDLKELPTIRMMSGQTAIHTQSSGGAGIWPEKEKVWF